MTDFELLLTAGLIAVAYFLGRSIYRGLSYSRAERAFLDLAASRGLERSRAIDFINLARAKGTTAMEEVSAEAAIIDQNDIGAARQQAAIAVMERAARDEFKRLVLKSDVHSFEEMGEIADAAGIAMLNQYTALGAPLGPDSPMGVAALRALIDNCNDDLEGIPENERYVTTVGRVATAAAKSR